MRYRELQQSFGDKFVAEPGAEVAAVGAEAQDFIERYAHTPEIGRQVEELAILPVPADQPHVLVEHAQSMPHLIERGL